MLKRWSKILRITIVSCLSFKTKHLADLTPGILKVGCVIYKSLNAADYYRTYVVFQWRDATQEKKLQSQVIPPLGPNTGRAKRINQTQI